jgi:integrase
MYLVFVGKITATLYKYQDGRSKPWRVRWREISSGTTKAKFFANKKDALSKKKEVEEFYNNYSSLAEKITPKDMEDCQNSLAFSTNLDAKGKSLAFAVEWFVANFVEEEGVKTIREYLKEWKKLKLKSKKKPSGKTIKEWDLYLFTGTNSFEAVFGDIKPTQLKSPEIQEWIDVNTMQWHRLKNLKGFISWLCGQSKVLHNPTPPIKVNPLLGVDATAQKVNHLKVFASNEEVCQMINLGHKDFGGVGAFWGFMFATGMRPTEAKRFWESRECGWKMINLDGPDPCVRVPAEIIKKKGAPVRIIPLRKGWCSFLKKVKSGQELEFKMATVKNYQRSSLALKKKVFGSRLEISSKNDQTTSITRHTFATNLYLYEGNIAQVCNETGDTESTLKKHYLNPNANKKDAVKYFEQIDGLVFELGQWICSFDAKKKRARVVAQ